MNLRSELGSGSPSSVATQLRREGATQNVLAEKVFLPDVNKPKGGEGGRP